jgi:hypothetical protein
MVLKKQVFTQMDKPTALLTISDEGPGKPMLVDLRLGGVGEMKVLTALSWAAGQLGRDIYNRAVAACGTDETAVVIEYMKTKQHLEDQTINDILGNI